MRGMSLRAIWTLGIGFGIGVLASIGMTRASVDGAYDLTWWSIDGGGAASASGGNYALSAVLGQPDAFVASGGGYVLSGGLLQVDDEGRLSYLPLVLR